MSVPFFDEEFTFTQPDGTQFQAKGWGDQHYAIFETLDGFTIVQDPETGFYCYARANEDASELESTGVKVGLVEPSNLALSPHTRLNPSVAKERALQAAGQMELKRRCEERREQAKQRLRQSLRATGPLAAPPGRQIQGQYVGLCLLIQFPDVPGTISQQEVSDFCNKPGYSGYGNKGSVYDYFYDNSEGKLEYTNLVTTYYTAKQPRAYYTNEAIEQGTRARELIKEGLAELKRQGFDFSTLSVDDQGYIYAVNVFYAGPRVNNWAQGLWPHAWSLAQPYELAPGKQAFDYQITNMGSELSLGTFCHENGHMLCDYPDLYDYGDQSSGVGHYCLMGYGGSDKKNPVQIGAYLKYKSGWANPLTLIQQNVQEATIAAGKNDFFLYPKHQAEYFIIENRQKAGRDAALPSKGLAIWHVDELGSNDHEQMTASLHYECSLEQADNQFDLEHHLNPGDAGDLFAKDKLFSSITSPSSNWWDGTPSRLTICDISEAGSPMTFRVQIGDDEGETQLFQATSTPAQDIPDNSQVGIRDGIRFTEAAIATSIKVSVDITHPYRGDLRVTLSNPLGRAVVLHDRLGGREDDLKRTFDLTSSPALRNFLGQSLQGEWVLHVQDLAPSDVGRFNSWSLAIEGKVKGGAVIALEESPGVDIPDNDPVGIERTLTVETAGPMKEVEVSVDITHTYVQDLIVTLISPQGTKVDLHHRSGGAADNIIKTYTLQTTPGLQQLIGQSIQGGWGLKVVDVASQDRGKLNRWSLKLKR
ncbi:MAG: M6 family metalloprotease domain-containing protein [Thainema sp.]